METSIAPYSVITEAVVCRRSSKDVFLKISPNSQDKNCVSISFLIKLQAWDTDTVFSTEFCKMFWKTFLYRTPPKAVSI